MSINCIALGKRICFYRLKFNITQEKLAALTNCSREYIAYLESGTKTPSLPTLIDLANVLHTPNLSANSSCDIPLDFLNLTILSDNFIMKSSFDLVISL